MEISSNINVLPLPTEPLLPQSNIESQVPQANVTALNVSDVGLGKVQDLPRMSAELTVAGELGAGRPGKIHEFAQAAIDAIVGFINSLTVVWEPSRPTNTAQVAQALQQGTNNVVANPQTPAIQPAAPEPPVILAPAVPEETVVSTPSPVSSPDVSTRSPSLLPSSARIFEFTNKSEWHPGLFNQKAYVDLRPELKGRVSSIKILSPDGASIVATGKLERVGSDGRPRFRFDRPAASIPQGAIIMANLTNNDGVRYIELDRPSRAFRW